MISVNLIRSFDNPQTFRPWHLPSKASATSPALKIEHGTVGNAASERILDYLAAAEFKEIDPWVRDDYRVAWLTVLRCSEIKDYVVLAENAVLSGKRVGEVIWEFSFWMYYGLVPEKALKLWALRDREREAFFATVPKKPSSSVSPSPRKKRTA